MARGGFPAHCTHAVAAPSFNVMTPTCRKMVTNLAWISVTSVRAGCVVFL